MQNLQRRAEGLKDEQIRLRQVINEKNTASILVGLFSTEDQNNPNKEINDNNKMMTRCDDSRVEELLGRPVEEIPDASNIAELPALILPGQHNSKKKNVVFQSNGKTNASTSEETQLKNKNFHSDGIDYDLLGKDRSKCTPAELDQIRRERNRMHAKRTRDRKRLFMEEMEEVIKRLETENELLKGHVENLNLEHGVDTPTSISENNPPLLTPPVTRPALNQSAMPTNLSLDNERPSSNLLIEKNVAVDQINSLLKAAGAFDRRKSSMGLLTIMSVASIVSATNSEHENDDISHDDSESSCPLTKRKRLDDSSPFPKSITC